MNKERFTGFSDAIIAIEVTILILEIEAPEHATLSAVLNQAGSFAAFIASFLLMMATWYFHHNIINAAHHITFSVYLANTLWIFVMSLFPFATAWVGRYPFAFLPECLFVSVTLVWMLAYSFLVHSLIVANPEQRFEFYALGNSRINLTWRYGIIGLVLLILPWWPVAGILGQISLGIASAVLTLRNNNRHQKINKSRLIAFTDGIIAIIVTLLVLQLAVPSGIHIQNLFSQGIKFVAYAISFLFIMIVWYNHHDLFNGAKMITTVVYWDNVVWLLFLSLFPYVTAFVGEFPNKRLPEWLYVIVQLCWSLSYTKMAHDLRRLNPEDDAHIQFVGKLNGYNALALYGGLIIAFVMVYFIPVSGLVVTILLAIFNVIRAWQDARHHEKIQLAEKQEAHHGTRE
ncbi:MAG TPA: hypothetical protein DCW31_09345 [Lactobacillus sp.]|mgnify:CR=1 FL=1|nr:hypothetical protein [Lactobacillus sp.]